MDFVGAHILSVTQFDRADIAHLFATADRCAPYALRQKKTRVLEGAILGNMFFESSTRTRLSFGTAFNLLGGQVRETTGLSSSALVKGESLYDTARVLSGYSDIICMRHPEPGSVAEFAAASRVPVINGGDGPNEHPTQALLDLYTIARELKTQKNPPDKGDTPKTPPDKGGTQKNPPDKGGRGGLGCGKEGLAGKGNLKSAPDSDSLSNLDGLRIAMIGDLKYGRTVHSLCRLLCLYKNVRLVLISPPELQMPQAQLAALKAAGHQVQTTEDLEAGIEDVQIVYSTRIQTERFPSAAEADLYRGRFRLNQAVYTRACQPNTVIMHPLPRDSRAAASELDQDLDSNPNLAIFRQADNGVRVRMALFALILGVDSLIEKYQREVSWHSAKSRPAE